MCKKIPVYRNQKNESLQDKTCQIDEKKWSKLDLVPRTAVRPLRPNGLRPKKTAKIDDFRSVLREKKSFLIET